MFTFDFGSLELFKERKNLFKRIALNLVNVSENLLCLLRAIINSRRLVRIEPPTSYVAGFLGTGGLEGTFALSRGTPNLPSCHRCSVGGLRLKIYGVFACIIGLSIDQRKGFLRRKFHFFKGNPRSLAQDVERSVHVSVVMLSAFRAVPLAHTQRFLPRMRPT